MYTDKPCVGLHQILYKIWGKINTWWAKSKGLDRIVLAVSKSKEELRGHRQTKLNKIAVAGMANWDYIRVLKQISRT